MRKPYITLRDRTWKGKEWFTSCFGQKNIRMLTDEEAEKLENIQCVIKPEWPNNGWPETVEECRKIIADTYLTCPRKKKSYLWGIKGSSICDARNEIEAWWCLLDYYKIKQLF